MTDRITTMRDRKSSMIDRKSSMIDRKSSMRERRNNYIFVCLAILILIICIKESYATISQGASDTNLNSTNESMAFSAENDSNGSDQVLYLSSSYYGSGDVVNISISNMSYIDVNAQLSLEITLKEDPGYAFRYLGSVGESVLFVPQKVGTYVISLYEIVDSNMVLLSEKSFLVYDSDSSTCKGYNVGDNVEIDFRSYAQYNDTSKVPDLPLSVSMIYLDDITGKTEKYIYSQEIKPLIYYEVSKSGKYSLFADDQYLDCFVVRSYSNSSNLSVGINDNSTNDSGIYVNNMLDNVSIQSLLDDMQLKNDSGSQINASGDGDMDIINFTQGNLSSYDTSKELNFSLDKIIEMKASPAGLVFAKISRGGISDLNDIWIFDINTGASVRIGHDASAPAQDFSLGLKDDHLFWLSEDRKTIFAYNTMNNTQISEAVPEYDISKGEFGIIHFVNDPSINWTIMIDNSQFYFYSNESGQVFSDDNMDIKEAFRKKVSLDHLMDPGDIASLGLEIDRTFSVNESK